MTAAFERIERTIDVGALGLGEGSLHLAIDVFIPPRELLREPAVAFFCVPGGGLNRRYFDLPVEGDTSFSFAAQMARRGMITIAIDPLGVGGSSRPVAGFDLVPDVATAALAPVHRSISDELRSGTLAPQLLPPLPQLLCVGVGHSLGGMLTVMQQARFGSYDALILLGFGTGGMPEVLSDEAKALAYNPAAIRANIVRLARAFRAEPYSEVKPNGRGREIFGGSADPRAMNALRATRDRLSATLSMFVIIPGSTTPEAAQIDVPVLLAVGDQDMCGPTHLLPASFSGSSDVTLLRLPDTGHSHFIFASAPMLFARAAQWAGTIAATVWTQESR